MDRHEMDDVLLNVSHIECVREREDVGRLLAHDCSLWSRAWYPLMSCFNVLCVCVCVSARKKNLLQWLSKKPLLSHLFHYHHHVQSSFVFMEMGGRDLSLAVPCIIAHHHMLTSMLAKQTSLYIFSQCWQREK